MFTAERLVSRANRLSNIFLVSFIHPKYADPFAGKQPSLRPARSDNLRFCASARCRHVANAELRSVFFKDGALESRVHIACASRTCDAYLFCSYCGRSDILRIPRDGCVEGMQVREENIGAGVFCDESNLRAQFN